MPSQLIILLLILTAFQCGVLAVFLLRTRRWRRLSNAALALMLVLLCVQMAAVAAQWSGWLPESETLNFQCGLLYGPCAFFYVRGLLYDQPGLGWRTTLHGLPFLAASSLWWVGGPPWQAAIPLVMLSFGAYLAACVVAVRRYRRIAGATRSQFQGLTMRWLRLILGLWGGVWGLYGLLLACLLAGWMHTYIYVSIGLYAVLLVSSAALIFAALEHPQLFTPVTAADAGLVAELAAGPVPEPVPRPTVGPMVGPAEEPAAADAEAQRLAARIAEAMAQARPYLRPDLSLAQLAEQLGLPPRRVSAAINRGFGQNFSDYVNSHRIEAAKQRLADPAAAGESILEVLYATGFNSKSVFNAAFKLKTGLSPSQYRTQCGIQHGPSAKQAPKPGVNAAS